MSRPKGVIIPQIEKNMKPTHERRKKPKSELKKNCIMNSERNDEMIDTRTGKCFFEINNINNKLLLSLKITTLHCLQFFKVFFCFPYTNIFHILIRNH